MEEFQKVQLWWCLSTNTPIITILNSGGHLKMVWEFFWFFLLLSSSGMHMNAHSGAVATTPCTMIYECGVLCSTRSLRWVGLAQHWEGTRNQSVLSVDTPPAVPQGRRGGDIWQGIRKELDYTRVIVYLMWHEHLFTCQPRKKGRIKWTEQGGKCARALRSLSQNYCMHLF